MNYIVVLDLTRKVWQFEGKNHRLCDVREVEYIFVYICILSSWRKEKRRTRRGGWRLITRARRKLVERIEVEIRLLLDEEWREENWARSSHLVIELLKFSE